MENYNCCNGNPDCALNRLALSVDKILAIKSKSKRREVLLDWILNLEDELSYLRFKLKAIREKQQT